MNIRVVSAVVATVYLVLGFLLLTEIFTPYQPLPSRGELESFNAIVSQDELGLNISSNSFDTKKVCRSFWISDEFVTSVPKNVQLQILTEPGYSRIKETCIKVYEVVDGEESYLTLNEVENFKRYSRRFFKTIGVIFLFASFFYYRKLFNHNK